MIVFCKNFLRASATRFYPFGLSGLVVFVTLHLTHVRIVSHLGLALRGGASNSTVTVTVHDGCRKTCSCGAVHHDHAHCNEMMWLPQVDQLHTTKEQ